MNRKKILIFDDDVNILELCSIVLVDYGYDVEVSETSHDIIEKVAQVNPDVILMDNWIPDIGGIKATQLLKSSSEFGHIPVIYFSANNDIHLLAETAGADAYLSKPFDLTELESIVSEAANKMKNG
ncbi:response regulator [Pseudopedobacter sp.]|uniref:response regulator n=1 Tax=Pseudopedobacter sp. TaxID=1936787 RepID=UPI003340C1B0